MDMKNIDDEIEALGKEWRSLWPMKIQDKERWDKKVRLEWNYNSNHIEGNTLTYHETELLLIFGRCEGGRRERHYTEMRAHDTAIAHIKRLAEDKSLKLTESDIRNLNKIVLKEPFWSKAQTEDGTATRKKIIPGQYKEQPNSVRTLSGETYKFAEPWEVPSKMQELMKWFCENMEEPPSTKPMRETWRRWPSIWARL